MASFSRRGRPKLRRPARDTGTPELRAKHRLALTAEPIDLCLERTLITRPQHWSGVHFRWLYTVRYGVPTPKAIDTLQTSHRQGIFFEDPIRQAECEEEYRKAIHTLGQHRLLDPVLSLCVYGRAPSCLYRSFTASMAIVSRCREEVTELREGLDVLATLWRQRLQQLQLADEKATAPL